MDGRRTETGDWEVRLPARVLAAYWIAKMRDQLDRTGDASAVRRPQRIYATRQGWDAEMHSLSSSERGIPEGQAGGETPTPIAAAG